MTWDGLHGLWHASMMTIQSSRQNYRKENAKRGVVCRCELKGVEAELGFLGKHLQERFVQTQLMDSLSEYRLFHTNCCMKTSE